MSDYRDEDRLPWLEPVDDYDDEDAISITRLIGAVVVGLVALGLVIGGIFWFRNRDNVDGNGALIEAQQGPVKERPEDAGGMTVEGAGDLAYGASIGEEINSVIDADSLPEEPLTSRPRGDTPAPAPAAKTPASPPAPVTVPKAEKPVPIVKAPVQKTVAPKTVTQKPTIATSSEGGSLIQLGAFSSPALANKAWSELSGRFRYLAGATHELSPVRADDKTLYRLRARVNGAGAICAKLRVAGEACSVLN